MWAWWWIFPVFLLLIVLACAVIFVLPYHSMDTRRAALRTLNKRFAKGEIGEQEYAAKKALRTGR